MSKIIAQYDIFMLIMEVYIDHYTLKLSPKLLINSIVCSKLYSSWKTDLLVFLLLNTEFLYFYTYYSSNNYLPYFYKMSKALPPG
jgi:hypothetical protein